mgnify:CR=1 FL=1
MKVSKPVHWLIGVSLLAALGAAVYWRTTSGEDPNKKAGGGEVAVTVVQPQVKDMPIQVELNGSVVPLFAEQIRKGGPVTVTDPEIKRFFMTIPEAVQLVLQASVLGQGGEVFVLDMGEQIKIVDLARNMIVLSGLVPGKDIEIVFTGLRPGEKLYEELFDESEQVESTAHEKINRAVGALPSADFEQWLDQLEVNLLQWSEDELFLQLRQRVPSFTPTMPQRVS